MTHDTYDTCFYNYYYIYLVYVLENKTFLPARVGIYENKCHKCHVSLLWVVCFLKITMENKKLHRKNNCT